VCVCVCVCVREREREREECISNEVVPEIHFATEGPCAHYLGGVHPCAKAMVL